MVQKDENIEEQNSDLKDKNIYYFEPEVRSYRIREEVNKDFFNAAKKIPTTKDIILSSAASNDVNLRFLKSKRDDISDLYINRLLRLKNEMKKSFMLQDHELNKTGSSYSGKFHEGVFVYPPRLTPVHDQVSEKLGSNYIGYFGIIEVNSKPKSRETRNYVRNNSQFKRGKYLLFYHVVADVKTGTVIYREIKKTPIKLSRKNLTPVIYDSFFVMNKNIYK